MIDPAEIATLISYSVGSFAIGYSKSYLLLAFKKFIRLAF